jgi:hypothetical protein
MSKKKRYKKRKGWPNKCNKVTIEKASYISLDLDDGSSIVNLPRGFGKSAWIEDFVAMQSDIFDSLRYMQSVRRNPRFFNKEYYIRQGQENITEDAEFEIIEHKPKRIEL